MGNFVGKAMEDNLKKQQDFMLEINRCPLTVTAQGVVGHVTQELCALQHVLAPATVQLCRFKTQQNPIAHCTMVSRSNKSDNANGNCALVPDDAIVPDNAIVTDDAKVPDDAIVPDGYGAHGRITMERQIQMQDQMRERMAAMQVTAIPYMVPLPPDKGGRHCFSIVTAEDFTSLSSPPRWPRLGTCSSGSDPSTSSRDLEWSLAPRSKRVHLSIYPLSFLSIIHLSIILFIHYPFIHYPFIRPPPPSRRSRNPKVMAPLLPLTFIVGYQADLAYGTKLNRIK
jgi:hypothetical protein